MYPLVYSRAVRMVLTVGIVENKLRKSYEKVSDYDKET